LTEKNYLELEINVQLIAYIRSGMKCNVMTVHCKCS